VTHETTSTDPTDEITWTSHAPEIAAVDSQGVVTGIAAGGPVEITATGANSGQSDSAEITVLKPDAVDVQQVINEALGITQSDFDGDIDNNGSVNAVDVQLVINTVLAG